MSNVFKDYKRCGIVVAMFILLFFSFGLLNRVRAENLNTVNIYFFYGDGCPHCAKEKEFLEKYAKDNPERVVLHEFEVYNNEDNVNFLIKIAEHLNIQVTGVPFTVLGEKYFSGYGSDTTTGIEIAKEIIRCNEYGCVDNISGIVDKDLDVKDVVISEKSDVVMFAGNSEDERSPLYLETKLLGKIDLKSISLPIATFIIALMDGFNPCAMWILIFLITMLINMKDRKKLYILGSVFIFISGLVYFVFLVTWFNFFKYIDYINWIKTIIGIVAVITGIMHVKDALVSKGGCHATNEKQRKNIINRIKNILAQKSFGLAILGIITLAISVNLIELVCSAGLPAIYTNLLLTAKLSTFKYYLYLIFYVLVFMFDDLFIFFVAVKSFEVTGISKKYTKITALVGGVLILVLGVILIVKPELLMFG